MDIYLEELTTPEQIERFKPLIGRDKERQTILEIINRHDKSNPVLIGHPGVGKTALIEDLARRIVEGQVPEKISQAKLYLFKTGALLDNIRRQSAETVFKQLTEEIRELDHHAILYIDEIHQLVGEQFRGTDIETALKKFLVQSSASVLGATTIKEYKYIEQDQALERRFSPVYVHEPSVEETIEMLNVSKHIYEKAHGVVYMDGVTEFIAEAAKRYVTDRYLPDKAFDLLDIVGSKVNLSFTPIDTHEIDGLISAKLQETANEVNKAREITQDRKDVVWEKAHSCMKEVYELEKSKEEYVSLLLSSRFNNISITTVKNVLEEHLGVSVDVGLTNRDEIREVLKMNDKIKERLIGQDEAVNAVVRSIASRKVGNSDKKKPIGSFLFYGPSGVGKTEMAKQIALELFGNEDHLLRIDMNEYQESHTISNLLGSPPGYIGHGDGANVFEQIRKKPRQVILVDEIEKGHPQVLDVFLNILDEGMAKDRQGNKLNFRETIIIMTTNATPEQSTQKQIGFGKNEEEQSVLVFHEFKKEFINRFTNVIGFKPLGHEVLEKILDLNITKMKENYLENDIELEYSDEAKQYFIEKYHDNDHGARPMLRGLQQETEDIVFHALLEEVDTKCIRLIIEDGKLSRDKHQYIQDIQAEDIFDFDKMRTSLA